MYYGLETNAQLVGADPKRDKPAGIDELGRPIYETPTGKKYYVGDVERPDSIPDTAKKLYEAIPPMEDWRLPTGEEFWGAAKGAAKAVGEGLWDVVESPTNPDATLGNAMDAASMGFTGAFSRVGKELDPSILSAGGAAPRYKKKISEAPVSTTPKPSINARVGNATLEDIDIEQALENLDFGDPDQGELSILGQIGGVDEGARAISLREIAEIDLGITTPENIMIARNLSVDQNNLEYIQQVAEVARQNPDYQQFLQDYQAVLDSRWNDIDGLFNPSTNEVSDAGSVTFQSPLQDVLDGWEFPKNGITGAQFLKGLQDNPTIRNSDIKSWGLELDPQKRYTKDELLEIIQPRQYKAFVENQDVFGAYQRQTDLKDPEVGYTELIVRGSREGDVFTANSQHYAPDTLAHARVSERKGPDGNYLLVEEIQSDLLQQGYRKHLSGDLGGVSKSLDTAQREFRDTVYANAGISIQDSYTATAFSEIYSDQLFDLASKSKRSNGVLDVNSFEDLIKSFSGDLVNNNAIYQQLERRGLPTGRNGLAAYYINLANNILEGEVMVGNDPSYSDIFMDILDIEFGAMLPNIPPENLSNYIRKNREILDNPPSPELAPVPPIAKTEESVRLAIEAAIAEADKRGLTQVVIPPFDKIIEKRFWQPEDIAKAKDPKSGFYQTYVKSLKKVLDGLQSEYSDGITISSRPLEYRGSAIKTSDWARWAEDTFAPALANRLGRYRPPRTALNEASNDFMDYVISTRDPDLRGQTPSAETFHVMNTIQEDLGIDLAPWVTSVNNAVEDAFTNNNPVGAPSLEEFLKDALSDKKGGAATLEGTVIDFSGLVNEGYDLSKPKFAEGGVVEQNNMDPVSGNPVPPGALPQEVRDDVDAKVSEGEYIIPANVVRFLGLDKLEKMVAQAEQKLLEMDQTGRIGGEKEGDLPFRKEELEQVEDAPQGTPPPAAIGQAPVKMAEGGVVPGYKLPSVDEGINPLTGLPWWMTEEAATDETLAPATNTAGQAATAAIESDGGREGDWNQEDPTGLSAGVDTWSPKDFVTFANSQGSPEQGVGRAVTSMIPGGALLYAGRQRYLQRNVPEKLSQMISTGQDLQGNPLSEEQMADLMAAEETLMNSPQRKGILGGFLGKREPMVTELTKPFQQTGGAEVARAAGVYKEATPTEVETPTSRNRSTSVVPTRGKYNYSTDFNRTPGMPNDPRETGGTLGRAAAGGPGADPLNRMSGVLRDHRRSQEANRDLLDRATDAQTKRAATQNRRSTSVGGGDGGRENAAERAARETSRNQARDALDNFERNTRNVDRTDPQTRENARDIKDRLEDRARGVTSRGFKKGGLVTKRKC